MKVLFVGLGSIGSRHLKNLFSLAKQRELPLIVHGLRHKNTPLSQELAPLVETSFHSSSDCHQDYDIIFITNPTTLHESMIMELKNKGNFFFIEKPIFHKAAQCWEALGLTEFNSYVACPLRHTKAYQIFKEYLKEKQVFSVRMICSSYLPHWRPQIDYRQNYSAIKKMGGGVTLDLIHELDYMVDLFGFPEKSVNFRGTYSDLEIDSDDLSVYIAKYKDKICEVHLDYFGRVPRRSCEAFTKEGLVTMELNRGSVQMPDSTVIDCSEEVNERYIREMNVALDIYLEQKNNPNSGVLANEILNLALKEGI